MDFETWVGDVPDCLKRDPIWQSAAYPKAVWLHDLAWQDCEQMQRHLQGKALVSQLIRSVDSISANLDEGFGRGIERKEYTQYLRFALGSARETRSRYYKIRHTLRDETYQHRLSLCNEIIAILTSIINKQKEEIRR